MVCVLRQSVTASFLLGQARALGVAALAPGFGDEQPIAAHKLPLPAGQADGFLGQFLRQPGLMLLQADLGQGIPKLGALRLDPQGALYPGGCLV